MTTPETGTTVPGGDPQAAALHALAAVLRGHGFTTELQHPQEDGEDSQGAGARLRVARPGGGRPVFVQARPRPDDASRLWFCWAGGVWFSEADHAHLQDALVHVKRALRQVPHQAAPALGRGGA